MSETVEVKRRKPIQREAWRNANKQLVIDHCLLGKHARETATLIGCSIPTVKRWRAEIGVQSPYLLRTITQRFEQYSHPCPNTGCWWWSGSVNGPLGYGQIRDNRDGVRKLRRASHVALEIAGRTLPDGLEACHTCDNPECVNPDHLFPGTHTENMRDALQKGRLTFPPLRDKRWKEPGARCIHGHEITVKTIRILPSGDSYCVICRRKNNRLRRERKRNSA